MKEFLIEYIRVTQSIPQQQRVSSYSQNMAWNELVSREKALGYTIVMRGCKQV